MRTSTRTAATALALLALGLPLAACGEDAPPESRPAITSGTDSTDVATDAATDAATDTAATNGPSASPDTAGDVYAAIGLAEAEAGGTAFEVDREDDHGEGWEVSVAVGEEEVDVHVDLAGTEVLGTDRDDDLDPDERAALAAAGITLADAIRTALAEVDGVLEDVDLDAEDGTPVWEVSIEHDAEVHVEVATGEVRRVERD